MQDVCFEQPVSEILSLLKKILIRFENTITNAQHWHTFGTGRNEISFKDNIILKGKNFEVEFVVNIIA